MYIQNCNMSTWNILGLYICCIVSPLQQQTCCIHLHVRLQCEKMAVANEIHYQSDSPPPTDTLLYEIQWSTEKKIYTSFLLPPSACSRRGISLCWAILRKN